MNALFERCRLFGHRGNSQQYLENTLDAFEACIQDGIDGIELDVQRTRCGTLVVFHDFTLSRLAGVDRRICEMEWEELKEIPIGGNQRIPTLEQVFALIGNRLLYDIELKAEGIGRTGLEEGVFKAIEDAGLQGNVLVSSFNPILLRRFKRRARNTIPTAVIYSRSKEVPTFLHEGQGRFLSRPTLLKPEREQALPMIERGKAVVVWTVDDEAEAQLLVAKGAKGIISNRPTALAHLFRG